MGLTTMNNNRTILITGKTGTGKSTKANINNEKKINWLFILLITKNSNNINIQIKKYNKWNEAIKLINGAIINNK